ncbi:MAG TPA: hypothetical protein VM935_08210 [Chitinophagaceae bacterium]|nr:hypothetical protein [Chitinophagaceae bacterium]
MTSLLLILTLVSFTPDYSITDSIPLKSKIYIVDIYLSGSGATKGYLQAITDTTLQLSSREKLFGYNSYDVSVPYHQVEHLSLHKKGSIRGGLLTGALLGGAVGAIAGLALNKSCTNCVIDSRVGRNLITGLTIGLPLGAAIGYLIGRRRHAFDISRDRENFEKMRLRLIRSYGDKSHRGR